ncbi:MBL fold metallo-hydrolase [Solitalea sp. MAHUQ-68]|uniref:MBL fold metallo-hydrolase n=1 Tax=Solitalea agri TaxID=2953739 RepID=A0A9X2JE12_9SPHI|nr:MBL fold metallo-hydrolase [Solitalea agri]MCO4291941.1 MBL fold metallo-hydrolase [Solitalea agri]
MIEIAKNVYQLPLLPRNSINCYIVDDLLIDAGIRASASKILRALKFHKINAHALTHAHADHQGSSSLICKQLGIPLWTSEKEKSNAMSGSVVDDYPNPKHFIARFQQLNWAGKGFKVSKTLAEGDEVGSFTVIETPGHSKGHISFFRESDRLLIAGDALVNMNLLTTVVGLNTPPALFTTDMLQMQQSVLKLYKLNPSIICFGHGPVLRNDKGQFEKLIARMG